MSQSKFHPLVMKAEIILLYPRWLMRGMGLQLTDPEATNPVILSFPSQSFILLAYIQNTIVVDISKCV